MSDAVDFADTISYQRERLHALTADISSINLTIQKISQQTKVLVLNTTIEVARAGATGSGFAVLVKQINDLAAETNYAAESTWHQTEVVNQGSVGVVRDEENESCDPQYR